MEQIALPTDQVPDVQVGILYLRLNHLSRACVLNVSTFPSSSPLSVAFEGGESRRQITVRITTSFCSDPTYSMYNTIVVSCLSVPYLLPYNVLPLASLLGTDGRL